MKKQPIRRFAVLLFIGVAAFCGIHFAMPVPDVTEIEIRSASDGGKYNEIRMRMEEIQRSHKEKGREHVCYENGYVQEKPALFRDRTEIYIPYMAYQMRNAGTVGTPNAGSLIRIEVKEYDEIEEGYFVRVHAATKDSRIEQNARYEALLQ